MTESQKFNEFDGNTQTVMMPMEWILSLSVRYIVLTNVKRRIVMVQERCTTVTARIGSQGCSVTGNPSSVGMTILDVIQFMAPSKIATFWKMVRALYPMTSSVDTFSERRGKALIFRLRVHGECHRVAS